MVQFDGLCLARLKVGIISVGRAGTALGVALERTDHVVVCSTASPALRQRVQHRLPETTQALPAEVTANTELLLLSVSDSELAGLVSGLVVTSAVLLGTIVAHTAGANGVGILAALSKDSCIPLAIHSAITFIGSEEDLSRLPDTRFGITAADDIGCVIDQSLVLGWVESCYVFARTPAFSTTPF